MVTALTLSPEQQARLRQELQGNRRANVYRRAAALLALHRGGTVTQVAELLGVTRQSVYNWIATYGKGGAELDLADARRTGRPSLWTAELQAALAAALKQTPAESGYTDRHWSISLLRRHLATQSGRQISEAALRRKLRPMGGLPKRSP